ncbi:dienelactone hydrolase family protein [Sorangium cellulosum]|uniref:dienelactone hydrolase family protein n=1 Tax=Sorangium cellulosum TaxID=56 RepID=UPI00031E8AC3
MIAAASYHGGNLATDDPDSPQLLAPRIRARVYVAGAVEDASFPDQQKQRLIDALQQAGVQHAVETYEGAKGQRVHDAFIPEVSRAARHVDVTHNRGGDPRGARLLLLGAPRRALAQNAPRAST